MGRPEKDIFIVAGPNGAGKTTAARHLLPVELALKNFLNADEIARAISPDNPESAALEAGRRMLLRMRELIRSDSSFAFETTLSGRTYLKFLQECQREGWRITLIYLWVPSPEYAITRVAKRVSQGGHGIPDEVIRRRFLSGLKNMLDYYLPLADDASIYDNRDRGLRLVARRRPRLALEILEPGIWETIQEMVR